MRAQTSLISILASGVFAIASAKAETPPSAQPPGSYTTIWLKETPDQWYKVSFAFGTDCCKNSRTVDPDYNITSPTVGSFTDHWVVFIAYPSGNKNNFRSNCHQNSDTGYIHCHFTLSATRDDNAIDSDTVLAEAPDGSPILFHLDYWVKPTQAPAFVIDKYP